MPRSHHHEVSTKRYEEKNSYCFVYAAVGLPGCSTVFLTCPGLSRVLVDLLENIKHVWYFGGTYEVLGVASWCFVAFRSISWHFVAFRGISWYFGSIRRSCVYEDPRMSKTIHGRPRNATIIYESLRYKLTRTTKLYEWPRISRNLYEVHYDYARL
jgi:hypothetical protein